MGRWAALVCAAATLVLTSCGTGLGGCDQPALEARPAALDGTRVAFEARILDEDGQPVAGAEVGMIPRFRFPSESGPGSGVPVASGTSGVDGIVRVATSVAHLQREGSGRGLLQPAWVASFESFDDIAGESYCTTEVDGEIPQEIVEKVNSGIDASAFQTDNGSSSGAGASDPIVPPEVEEQLENLEQPTIPPPKGNAPDLDDM